MIESRRWAVAQMTGGSDVDANIAQASRLVERAASLGCSLVALPENTTFMGHEKDKSKVAEPLDGPSVSRLAEMAARHQVAILVGSIVERSADPRRPYNTSVLLDQTGQIVATYRKIHLFDVDLPNQRVFRESHWISPGQAVPSVARIEGVTVGFTICFDLRFAWLYRALADRGAQVIFVPAAFTEFTGRDHWEVLLRARAIEAQSFILAPAQFGQHDTGRRTYGRSLLVDPWGTILATIPDGGDLGIAWLDLSRVDEIRRRLPLHSRHRDQAGIEPAGDELDGGSESPPGPVGFLRNRSE